MHQRCLGGYPNLRYDSSKDLTPVSLLARIPLVMLVNNDVPATTVKAFADFAKAGGAKRSYGSPGIGTSNHLYFEVLKDLAGMEMPHIAYKGGGPAMSELTRALQAREVIARLEELNAEPVMSSQEAFAAHLQREHDTLGKVIKARGITAR